MPDDLILLLTFIYLLRCWLLQLSKALLGALLHLTGNPTIGIPSLPLCLHPMWAMLARKTFKNNSTPEGGILERGALQDVNL